MAKKELGVGEVMLTFVRLSYPQLFVPKSIQGGAPTYSAAFLLQKVEDADQIKEVRRAMHAAALARWKDKIPPQVMEALPLKDGARKADQGGYGPEIMYVGGNNKNQPACCDLNAAHVLTRENGGPARLYAGCYVNAKLRFWGMENAQNPQWGKKLCCQLVAVQFAADGEPFGAGPVKTDEVFESQSGGGDFTDTGGGGGDFGSSAPQTASAPADDPFGLNS